MLVPISAGEQNAIRGKICKVLRGVKPWGFSTVADVTVTSGLALQVVVWKECSGEREQGGLPARPWMGSVGKVLRIA